MKSSNGNAVILNNLITSSLIDTKNRGWLVSLPRDTLISEKNIFDEIINHSFFQTNQVIIIELLLLKIL